MGSGYDSEMQTQRSEATTSSEQFLCLSAMFSGTYVISRKAPVHARYGHRLEARLVSNDRETMEMVQEKL